MPIGRISSKKIRDLGYLPLSPSSAPLAAGLLQRRQTQRRCTRGARPAAATGGRGPAKRRRAANLATVTTTSICLPATQTFAAEEEDALQRENRSIDTIGAA